MFIKKFAEETTVESTMNALPLVSPEKERRCPDRHAASRRASSRHQQGISIEKWSEMMKSLTERIQRSNSSVENVKKNVIVLYERIRGIREGWTVCGGLAVHDKLSIETAKSTLSNQYLRIQEFATLDIEFRDILREVNSIFEAVEAMQKDMADAKDIVGHELRSNRMESLLVRNSLILRTRMYNETSYEVLRNALDVGEVIAQGYDNMGKVMQYDGIVARGLAEYNHDPQDAGASVWCEARRYADLHDCMVRSFSVRADSIRQDDYLPLGFLGRAASIRRGVEIAQGMLPIREASEEE